MDAYVAERERLRKQFAAFLLNEGSTRLGEDIEGKTTIGLEEAVRSFSEEVLKHVPEPVAESPPPAAP